MGTNTDDALHCPWVIAGSSVCATTVAGGLGASGRCESLCVQQTVVMGVRDDRAFVLRRHTHHCLSASSGQGCADSPQGAVPGPPGGFCGREKRKRRALRSRHVSLHEPPRRCSCPVFLWGPLPLLHDPGLSHRGEKESVSFSGFSHLA